MIRLIVALLIVAFSGCSHSGADDSRSIPATSSGDHAKAADPADKIKMLEQRLADATSRGDEIARLSAVKDLVSERLRQAESEVNNLHAQKIETEKALTEARTNEAQTKLWWFVGIMGLACAALVALAIFIPAVSKWSVRGAIACGAISALAAFVSWLLPYLFWIGLVIVVVGVIAAIVFWRLDAKSRDQVVTAFEKIKDKVPDYRAHFSQHIDSDADKHLDAVRTRLGLKPLKVK